MTQILHIFYKFQLALIFLVFRIFFSDYCENNVLKYFESIFMRLESFFLKLSKKSYSDTCNLYISYAIENVNTYIRVSFFEKKSLFV